MIDFGAARIRQVTTPQEEVDMFLRSRIGTTSFLLQDRSSQDVVDPTFDVCERYNCNEVINLNFCCALKYWIRFSQEQLTKYAF
jgi:hypothetical protein